MRDMAWILKRVKPQTGGAGWPGGDKTEVALTSVPLQVAMAGWEGVSCSVGHSLGSLLSILHTASTPGTAGKPSTDRYLYKRQLETHRNQW